MALTKISGRKDRWTFSFWMHGSDPSSSPLGVTPCQTRTSASVKQLRRTSVPPQLTPEWLTCCVCVGLRLTLECSSHGKPGRPSSYRHTSRCKCPSHPAHRKGTWRRSGSHLWNEHTLGIYLGPGERNHPISRKGHTLWSVICRDSKRCND